jgi:hypothetical protein
VAEILGNCVLCAAAQLGVFVAMTRVQGGIVFPERAPANPAIQRMNEGVVRRIRAEFLEMPGLCLTIEQAQRLWQLEPRTCAALLTSLIDSRFLRRTDRGLFVLCRPGG